MHEGRELSGESSLFLHFGVGTARVTEAKIDTSLARLPDSIQVHELLVSLVRAEGHPLGIVHVVMLPVTQVGITAGLFEVRRLAYHQLTHLVDEEALAAGEQS